MNSSSINSTAEDAKPSPSLIRRYRRLLTFVGAFIVFATFMVKENFEAELGSEMAQMRNARNIFFMRTQMSQISNEIVDMANRLNVVSIDLDANDAAPEPATKAKKRNVSRSRELKARIWALESLLSNIDVLRASSEDKRLEMSQLGQRLKSLGEELNQPPFEPTPLDPFGAPQDLNDPVDNVAATNRAKQISREVTAVDKLLHELQISSARFSEETMQQRARQLHMARIASLALYVLGWSLGLVSKLAGQEDETGE